MEGSKATKALALEKAQKSREIAERLRKEVDAGRASGVGLATEVKRLKEQLDVTKAKGLAAAEVYTSALEGFGGVTLVAPAEAFASELFDWLSDNFAKLPNFVGKVVDFATLSSTTNLAKTLAKGGCGRVEELRGRKNMRAQLNLMRHQNLFTVLSAAS